MTDERPIWPCVVCPALSPTTKPKPAVWPQVCEGCRARLRRDLTGLPDMVAALPHLPATGHGPRVSGTPEPRLPVRIVVVDLTLPANAGSRDAMARGFLGLDDDQVGDLSVATILDDWVRDWHEVLRVGDLLPAPTISSLTAWLLVRLDTACDDHPAIDEFASDLSDTVRTVRAAANAGETRGEKVGKCPTVVRDDSRCGTQLRADPYVDRIVCPRCGSVWSRHGGGWLKLRGEQDIVTAEQKAVA